MKLERNALIHYLDASFDSSKGQEWFLVGKDIEDMSVSLNPDVQSKENILGETTTEDNGYSPSLDADPYYANPEDKIYPKLRDIAMNRLKGDACKTKILEVIIEDTEAPNHKAWMEDVIVKPQSYGGGTNGVNIPFNVAFDGNRQEGTVVITNKVPVFTPNQATAETQAES